MLGGRTVTGKINARRPPSIIVIKTCKTRRGVSVASPTPSVRGSGPPPTGRLAIRDERTPHATSSFEFLT